MYEKDARPGAQGKGLFMLQRLLVGRKQWIIIMTAAFAWAALQPAWAGDLRITIPRRSELTPVQRLNRQGVEAVRKHDYEKAEAIFYKAYLYDPADPFTLNNLGYIAELQGDLDRAQTFYDLAAKQGCNALIDVSSAKQLEGKPMTYALTSINDKQMRVNRMNVEAVELLSQNRNFEAVRLLRQALSMYPHDPFTLNNLAVADEATGNLDDALRYYDEASAEHSTEPIVVTQRRSWRGKSVSDMAAESAQQLRLRMQGFTSAQTQAKLLTYRGVAAVNRNDWASAKQDFLRAYSLDPGDAFTLNNLGYVSEKNGDVETAQFFYNKARQAGSANITVGLATRPLAEGEPLMNVASRSTRAVDRELSRYSRERQQETGPIELIPRGPGASNAPANPPANPPNSNPQPPQR